MLEMLPIDQALTNTKKIFGIKLINISITNKPNQSPKKLLK